MIIKAQARGYFKKRCKKRSLFFKSFLFTQNQRRETKKPKGFLYSGVKFYKNFYKTMTFKYKEFI